MLEIVFILSKSYMVKKYNTGYKGAEKINGENKSKLQSKGTFLRALKIKNQNSTCQKL